MDRDVDRYLSNNPAGRNLWTFARRRRVYFGLLRLMSAQGRDVNSALATYGALPLEQIFALQHQLERWLVKMRVRGVIRAIRG